MDKEILGCNLRFLRTANNLTQEEMAEKLGKKKSAIGVYENHKAEPGIEVLLKVSSLFNISVDDLIGKNLEDEFKNNGNEYLKNNGIDFLKSPSNISSDVHLNETDKKGKLKNQREIELQSVQREVNKGKDSYKTENEDTVKDFDKIFNAESVQRNIKTKKRIGAFHRKFLKELEKADAELLLFDLHIETFPSYASLINVVFYKYIETDYYKSRFNIRANDADELFPDYQSFKEYYIKDLKSKEHFSKALDQFHLSMYKFISEIIPHDSEHLIDKEDINELLEEYDNQLNNT